MLLLLEIVLKRSFMQYEMVMKVID